MWVGFDILAVLSRMFRHGTMAHGAVRGRMGHPAASAVVHGVLAALVAAAAWWLAAGPYDGRGALGAALLAAPLAGVEWARAVRAWAMFRGGGLPGTALVRRIGWWTVLAALPVGVAVAYARHAGWPAVATLAAAGAVLALWAALAVLAIRRWPPRDRMNGGGFSPPLSGPGITRLQ
jgi:hypothetical protein